MCNAWNHHAGCTCGWGGEGHLGRRESDNYTYHSSFREYSWDSLNQPTHCPICGEQVYFVQYNGGKVWFDELGPPWPKHSCFDDDLTGSLIRANLRQRGIMNSTKRRPGQAPKEYYDEQFKPCMVRLKGPGLKHFQDWCMLLIDAAFRSGIKTGW